MALELSRVEVLSPHGGQYYVIYIIYYHIYML